MVEAEGGCWGTSARPKVFKKANCIFTGACSNQAFVYTQGIYSSVSNEDFVRGSVTKFYESYNQKELLAFFEIEKLLHRLLSCISTRCYIDIALLILTSTPCRSRGTMPPANTPELIS